jgi:hypothetical protein
MRRFFGWMVTSAGAFAMPISAATCPPVLTAKSGERTVPVVELYTSEGCDSCPPADRWFAGLDATRVVPLAFHVDYWDYIGWKDRFADARYGERQSEAVRRQGGRTRYTPQVMLDGRDTRDWLRSASFAESIGESTRRTPRARLAMNADVSGPSITATLGVDIPFADDRRDAQVYFALTEASAQSRVSAGENRGKTLDHAHVVRGYAGPYAWRERAFTQSFAQPADTKREKLAVVAFVQDAKSGQTLQSLRVPLCGG